MNIAYLCLRTAVILGLVGFSMGFGMGVTQDFSLAPAHAHMNLLGWVSFFLYGGFYLLVPQAAAGWLPRVHYGLASALRRNQCPACRWSLGIRAAAL
jgi:hypothetical protein